MYNISLKILKLLPPELSHSVTINLLKYFKVRQKNIEDPILAQHLMGLDFTNPIGLAAGFDKNAEVMHSMFSFGFGFLEVGTITPQPQSGNSKPRVFRLSEDKAIINSLGFNNKGIKKVKKNLIKHQKSYLNNKIMSHTLIKRFVMFYERITLQMIKDLNKCASMVILLKKNHEIKKILFKS